jgi:hypothetical protein
MAKKFYETAEFQKLKKQWDQKLADSGFEDIEAKEDEHMVRPQEFTTPHQSAELTEYVDFVENSGLDYYQFCHQILREFEFKRELDRIVFELYTEGKTIRDISSHLEVSRYKPLKKSSIDDLIKRILDQNLPKPKSNS